MNWLGPQSAYIAQAPVQPSNLKVKPVLYGFSDHPARLQFPQWQTFPSGLNNAITDVPGIKVGHLTYRQDLPKIIRTGVTAIVPDAERLTQGQGNLATTGYRAVTVSLSGNGELTGSSFINEFGVLNSPILLTNTRSVGIVYESLLRYFEAKFPGQWSCQLPVVGECWDGFFNTIEQPVIPSDAAEKVIQQAKPGPVLQGRVGAGTGMRSFELHAGIGSASRKISLGGQEYTVGVLVNSNHSRLSNLNPVIRQQLESRLGSLDALRERDNLDAAHPTPKTSMLSAPRQGSIQVVIATDLPLSQKELEAVAKRAGLGIGHTGSVMATTSGDFVTAFSTAHPIPLGSPASVIINATEIHPDEMTSVYKATIEAVIEAQMNALVASHT